MFEPQKWITFLNMLWETRMRVPIVPASFFAMVLGIIGLGNSWRAAQKLWNLPAEIAEVIMALGVIVWAALVVLYALKWMTAAAAATAEIADPVQCCFVGLAGVATMLTAIALLPYTSILAAALFVIGSAFTYGFGLWRTGLIWRGGRNHAATTPVLYLPLVAGSFVCAIGLSLYGYPDWAQLAFGGGLFSWLAIESVLLHRLYTAEPLSQALRPTLGIQLAPPAVGALAYVDASGAAGDIFSSALIGYALLQAVLLGRMLPWIVTGFSASLWGFSFGATALATVSEILTGRGETGAVALIALPAFVLANLLVAALIAGTLGLLISGRLFPNAPPPPAATPQ